MITKENLGEFSSVSIFDEEHILVCRGGLYNLINKCGEYISNKWFKSIEKKENGGADFVVANSTKKVQLRSVDMWGSYHNLCETLNNTSVLHRLDTRCINIISPIKLYSASTNHYVTIIAKVNVFGKDLYLGKNGKLYTKDIYGHITEYELPEFFISYTDINRINDAIDKINCIYNSAYNPSNKVDASSTIKTMRERHTVAFAFGFDNTGYTFSTNVKNIIDKDETHPWGGETIKLRFDMESVPDLYKEKLMEKLTDMDFSLWTGKDSLFTNKAYTKTYTADELDEFFYDVKVLSNKVEFMSC